MGETKVDCNALWNFANKKLRSDIDFGEEGPKYLECVFKKLGAVSEHKTKPSEASSQSSIPAYVEHADDVKNFLLSRTDAVLIMKEAERIAASCKDGNARYRFIVNLLRMISIVIYINEHGPVKKVGSFNFYTWYEFEASKSKSFLKKLLHIQSKIHKEAKLKFDFSDFSNAKKLQKYTTSYSVFREVFEVLGFPLVKARRDLI